MPKNFDQIVKNALENYLAPYVPDWDVFYDLLQVEQNEPMGDDDINEDAIGASLAGLEYTSSAPAWDAFESRLDDLNVEMDAEFDQTIGDALKNIPEETWGAADWQTMSVRLDNLDMDMDAEFDQTVGDALKNIPEETWGAADWQTMSEWLDQLDGEMDTEFDQTIGDALVNIPESTWKEQHWQMLSSRLDDLNDKPRLLMMKVIEAAAILLILFQLSSLYSDFQQRNGNNTFLTEYIDQLFNSEDKSIGNNYNDIEVPPNSFPSSLDQETDIVAGKSDQQIINKDHHLEDGEHNTIEQNNIDLATVSKDQRAKELYNSDNGKVDREKDKLNFIRQLPINESKIQYSHPWNQLELMDDSDIIQAPRVAPQLQNPPNLIAYTIDTPNRLLYSTPRLGMKDINLLTTISADSILSSIPTLQVIRPRLHSSMEVGALADATTVEIQGAYTLLNPKTYEVPTFNPGLYFRYKIQYQDMFGSLGGDYVDMQYDGLINKNELAMVSLPVELGYNIVNIPSFRMYFSGGIAGRFVPVAKYSPDPFNQSSAYDLKSNKQSNGLLNNGPFEINSYLSGRFSLGLDINVNKKTSINLRFSHDIWLKGRGIGYNLDKFNSSHLGIGTNFHF